MSEALEQSDQQEGYKTVQLGPREIPIPDEWDIVPFDEAIELNPKYDKPDNGPFDYLPMDAVDEEKQTIEYWTQREKDDCTTTWFKNGDTVYAKITPCTENGKITFIDGMSTEVGSGSTEFLVFHPCEGVIEERFVYYLSNLPEFRSVTISLMEGSTGRQRVPSDVFKGNLTIPLPPLPEQRRVVDILSTVDEQIQQTDEIIEKFEELKKGIAHRLLDNGARSESKSDVVVGPLSIPLPESWELRRLENFPTPASSVVQTGPYGSKLQKEEFTDSGYKIYRQANINSGDFEKGGQYVTEEKYHDLEKYQVVPDDVLLTRMGTIGDAAVLPDDARKGIMDYHLFRIRIDPSFCLPEYLSGVLRSSRIVKHQIESFSHGAIMDGLNTGLINELRIPVPSTEEQREIVDILSTIDQRVSIEKERKIELKQLKRGLMQDLLTGKVRVDTD
ncbi:restriction endonuclease subunit S [Halosimplex rubrum]|uniref:Restriction endonuclease subunit S n=1 Tax=Halosimplex rubrum TaxID=869889 RepID=A0A7D5P381_9EURY|nr:restriction endonuclease subunit S [Halosimplex rubrum]QLH79823.1 restriction endonuclease subunit S [Halosimplex rubrum]